MSFRVIGHIDFHYLVEPDTSLQKQIFSMPAILASWSGNELSANYVMKQN